MGDDYIAMLRIVYEDAYQEIEHDDYTVQTYLAEQNGVREVAAKVMSDLRKGAAPIEVHGSRHIQNHIEAFAADRGIELEY